jgi:dipeptidyl aminopeptidase/acylaminoacyl peptidase
MKVNRETPMMHRLIVGSAILLLSSLLIASCSRADQPKRDHDITVDDYFTQADIFDCVISPDGKSVAYTEGRWQESTGDRKADLWVVDFGTSKSHRLTSDRAGDRAPKWSRDGQWIYFLGNRHSVEEKDPSVDDKPQVWRISARGGQPAAVTRVKDGVGVFELMPDGKSLLFTTEREEVGEEWKQLWHQFKDVTYGHGIKQVNVVWKLDLEDWRQEKLLDNGRSIRDMAISPDGRRLAMITTPDDSVISFEGKSQVDVYDLANKQVSTVPDRLFRAEAPSAYGWLERLAWAADSKALAFTIIFDAYPSEVLVAEWEGSEPTVAKLARPEGTSLRGYGSPIQWRGQSRDLCFLGEEKARVRLCSATDFRAGKYAEVRTLTPGDVVVYSFSFDSSGAQGAAVLNDPAHLQDIYSVKLDASPRQITHVNPQADSWKLPKMQIVQWQGANGDSVEGILELPPDAQPGAKLPLVVAIHGGPTTADYFGIQFWIYGRTLFPAKGYAVFLPNYRGSTGYGDKFLTDLVAHENNFDVEDILKGVDALIERGVADPDHLGVCGWSNGGYLTNCVISKTTIFKAASSGAGIADTVMEWGANDEPAYAIVFKKGMPWSKPENYRRAAPVFEFDKIRTPTLVHVGGSDDRCPPGQSRMLYRALHDYLNVPTELVIYPGEPHGLTKYKNRKAKMEWDLAWFEKYIKGNGAK